MRTFDKESTVAQVERGAKCADLSELDRAMNYSKQTISRSCPDETETRVATNIEAYQTVGRYLNEFPVQRRQITMIQTAERKRSDEGG